MILMEICIKGVEKNDDAKYNCRTAEQQNSRTAEQHLILRLFLEPFIWQIV
jgi:hypothetical protein